MIIYKKCKKEPNFEKNKIQENNNYYPIVIDINKTIKIILEKDLIK